MFRRRFKLLLRALVLGVLLLGLFLVFERVRGQASLARYRSQLIARGEKLSAADFRAPVAAQDNGGPEVQETAEHLTQGRVLIYGCPPLMSLTPSGHAIVGFREPEWIADGVTNDWAGATADLATNAAVLVRARLALARPVLNNELDLALGPNLRFPYLGPARRLAQWFGVSSQLALHEGNPHQAVEDLLTQLQLCRWLAGDRVVISQLVRVAIAALARADAWEALQADGWTDADLARLQVAWESQEFVDTMARSLEGERVYEDAEYDQLRKSNNAAANALFWDFEFSVSADEGVEVVDRAADWPPDGSEVADFLKKQVYCRIWRFAWSHQAQRHELEELQQLTEINRAAAAAKSFTTIEPALTTLESDAERKSWYDHLRYPGTDSVRVLSRTVEKALRAETERSLVLGAIALKRYSLRHGKPPETLEALVPEFLPSVPIDYMDGRPLRYRVEPDGTFTLYSVGANRQDDGGDIHRLPGKASIANLWYRKDVVWPVPATPEEVADFRQDSLKQ